MFKRREPQGKTGENPARSRHRIVGAPARAGEVFRVKTHTATETRFNAKALFSRGRQGLFQLRMQNAKCRMRSVITLVLVCAGFALATSCRSSGSANKAAAPTRVVTDDLGRQVTVPAEIKRVVSLAPSVTESVFAVGAGDKL